MRKTKNYFSTKRGHFPTKRRPKEEHFCCFGVFLGGMFFLFPAVCCGHLECILASPFGYFWRSSKPIVDEKRVFRIFSANCKSCHIKLFSLA